MKKIKKPNFFILGAPKSGTTSLAAYLKDHPDIFFSSPKEVGYFNTDFGNRKVFSRKEYLSYFKGAQNYKMVGEGSVVYLYSKEAVSNILEFNPEAKFIVMLRNPIQMAYSLHSQKIFNGEESISDFKKAWNKQDERKEEFKYGKRCKLGEQMERLYSKVEKDKVKVIIFDNFTENTKQAYEEVLQFLEVPSDNRQEFPVLQKNKNINSSFKKALVRFLKKDFITTPANKIKPILGIHSFGVWDFLGITKDRPPLSEDVKKEMVNYFEEDLRKLNQLIDKGLPDWGSLA